MSSKQKHGASGLVNSLLHARPTAEGKRAFILNKHEDNKLCSRVKTLEKRRKETLHCLVTRRQHFEAEHEEHLLPEICVGSSLVSRKTKTKPKITFNGREMSRLQNSRSFASLPDILDSIKKDKEGEDGRARAASCETLRLPPPGRDAFFISDPCHLSPPRWDYERSGDAQDKTSNEKTRNNSPSRARSLSYTHLPSTETDNASRQRTLSAHVPKHLPPISLQTSRKKSL